MAVNFNTVKSGDMIKWEEVGTKVVGILKDMRIFNGGKGEGHIFEVKTKEGTLAFFAPGDLLNKLKDIPLGNIVMIEYTEETKTNSGNTWKVFNVGWALPTDENKKELGLDMQFAGSVGQSGADKEEEAKEEDTSDLPAEGGDK